MEAYLPPSFLYISTSLRVSLFQCPVVSFFQLPYIGFPALIALLKYLILADSRPELLMRLWERGERRERFL